MAQKIFDLIERVGELFILNIIWILCSLPIITLGASTTALYYICMRVVRKEDTYTVRGFLKAFKENFVSSTIIWLLMLMVGGLIYSMWSKLHILNGAPYVVLGAVTLLLFLIWVLLFMYVFPLAARYENTVAHTVGNALIIAITQFKDTIWLMGVFLVPVIIIVFVPYAGIVLILFGGSGIGLITSFRYVGLFDRLGRETEENGEI